ncbi:CHASE3 domain-containing protein [Silvibacterium acidisoli]|uniref:CHASE3 domain-containing protein n=1 Tax=Acidobacteriaceae bacterium ZG23-2 TaxID=2883246 RepID=UPI00406D41D1
MNVPEFRRILRQTLLLPVLLLLVLAGFILWQFVQYQRSLQSIDKSEDIASEIVEVEKLIIDQETGLRGFQLTNDRSMLAPYEAATPEVHTHLDNLRTMIDGRNKQLGRLAHLRDSYELWLGFSQRVIARDPAVIGDPQLNQHAKQRMDDIREQVHQMALSEARQHRRLSTAAEQLERRQIIGIVLGALLVGITLGIFTLSRIRRVSRSYDRALKEVKTQAEEIYESRQWLQTTLESIGDAVIACDEDGRVKFINAVAQNLTGWNSHEAFGQPLEKVFNIINEETREVVENPVDKVRRLKTVVGLANHTALISKNGPEYIIDDSAAPIPDTEGNMCGIVLVFRDVTELRRAEAALVAGEKLAVAGRLAASIAHEIHNPLDSVANLHFLLISENDAERRTQYLQMAQQELGRTMQISRTLLSLYREPKAPVVVDLGELADGVLLLLERRLTQNNIEVTREIVKPALVEGFPAELRQVFTNVIVNALEATGKNGHMLIRIKPVRPDETRSAGMIVDVLDSGPGIANKDAKSLFQPFFTTKGEDGTGLGLWVSLGIIQKHGGTIRIANSTDPGYSGAAVQIYLPERTLASASSRATAHVIPGVTPDHRNESGD